MAKIIPRSKITKFSNDMKWVGSDLHISLYGPLNEDATFDDILEVVNNPEMGLNSLVINLGNITHINSTGLRKWILFLERVQAKAKVVFSLVNEIVIEQASITMNALGKTGTPVISFVVPYYCDQCKVNTNKILKRADIKQTPGGFKAPVFHCDQCKTPLEVDAIEKEYFSFLIHSKQ